MISTYTPLPMLPHAPAEAPPPGADNAQNDNTPSFQSRLNQQNEVYRAHRAPVSSRPAPAPPRPDDTDTNDAPDADANANVSSRTSDGADSVRRDDAENNRQADKAEEGDKDRRSNDITPTVTPALPFTSATLALAGGIAPIPTPAATVPTLAASEHTVNADQAASAPVPIAPSSAEANVSGLASTAALAGTNAASMPPGAFANGLLNIPLNTPGVSMDSNAAGKIAASGVANASLLIPAQTAPAPASLPLPNAANAALLAAPGAAKTGETLNTAQTAIPTRSVPLSATATNPGSLITAPATETAATAATATNTVQAAASQSASLIETVQADGLPTMPLAPGDTMTAQRGSKAASAVVASPPSGAATVISLSLPSTTPSGAATAADGAGGTNPSEAASKEQNLGGIERMLTLGAGKTGENGPSANAASAASASETAGAGMASASGLPTGEGHAIAAQRGGYAAPLPNTNTATPGTVASLANASPANADPTSAINPQTDTVGVIGTTNTLAAPLNSTVRMAEALQSGGKNSLTGLAPLLAAEPTALGANTTASLIATPDMSARSTSQDTLNGQAQSETPARSQENNSGDNATPNLNGVVSAPTANAQATAASGASASSGPNGSSQLDRAQVVAQVTQHLEGMRLANGNGEMRLHLTPGHLGNVQISVTAHQDGVVARIAVETAQIQQVMDGAKAHLRATLEARGLHVQSVDVTVTPHYNGSGQSTFGQQRSPESMGERMAERAMYGRAASGSSPSAADSAAVITRAAPLARTANARLDCQA